ncbi:tetratricopeptide repeat protein [Sinomicrobium sp. M5D2P9]
MPDYWNVYDSLGEAYLAAGNKEMAILNYKKSVEINPENNNGIAILKELKGK